MWREPVIVEEMGVVQAKIQTVEDIYRLVRAAVVDKRPIRATYHGRDRWLCPHRLGRITKARFVCCAISTLGRVTMDCKPRFSSELALHCTGGTQQSGVAGKAPGTRQPPTIPAHRPASPK